METANMSDYKTDSKCLLNKTARSNLEFSGPF